MATSQIRGVPLSDAVASRVPSGENSRPQTASLWACRVARVAPVATSQIRAVWSLEAVASRVPSGENATR